MITKFIKTLGIKNQELIKNGIDKTQISRWKKSGFPKSYEILLNLLLEKINGKIKS